MGILSNIDETIRQADKTVGLMDELTKLPNVTHAISFFKQNYISETDTYTYSYQFECPIILEKLNNVVNRSCKYTGFKIDIDVRCNTRDDCTMAGNNAITYLKIALNTEINHFVTIQNDKWRYMPRQSNEIFADSLFRIRLGTLMSIFRDPDTIYEYLSTVEKFRGYNLM